ncbi:rhamnogalacturonan lyase [Bacteroides sp. AN502(2024)]|uniref:rhamnogalacturonan lyase n=1 Tax=Bacteroides sp. AN502(2024) TaxID=3160599 RepID=UPI00351465C8
MKCINLLFSFCLTTISLIAQPNYDFSKLKRERLGRGVIAIRENPSTVVVSWRYLSSDPMNEAFDIYRNDEKINKHPLKDATFFQDTYAGTEPVLYTVKAREGKTESSYQLPANAPSGYLNIPLNRPEDGTTPAGQHYFYAPNDASIGDVDGDGEYEIVLKWDPSNAHDNSHDGYTGPVILDCYKLNGRQLWRIHLGRNIRAGAHYTQFMVYDLDGDGKAEVVMKTADGTVDGTGKVIGDAQADYRNEQGRILIGPEYLTLFNGLTGEAMQTIDYVPERGDWMSWGDRRGNRCDRFLACVAYLDGIHPSVVMCRGYYTRTVLAAFDWDGKELKQRWVFDSNNRGCGEYAGQGNHNLRVGDVDGDGCDEIIYGSCAIDHNGKRLYTTKMGHGDAIHLTHFDPSRKGLQVWDCHENKRDGSTYRDAATGEVLFQIKDTTDVGRCMAADIDPTQPGVEMWSVASGGVRNVKGEVVKDRVRGLSCNMAVWWDGDLLRELLDRNRVSKYNWEKGVCEHIAIFEGTLSNNGTKANPSLQGDMIGDWREEVLMRTADNTALRLYVSTVPTDYRFHTFLEDPIYRISIATQNVAYNQPTQPRFYFGPELQGTVFRGCKIGVTTYKFATREIAADPHFLQ